MLEISNTIIDARHVVRQVFVFSAAGSDPVQWWGSYPAKALLGPRHDQPGLSVQGEDQRCSKPTQCRHWNSQGSQLNKKEIEMYSRFGRIKKETWHCIRYKTNGKALGLQLFTYLWHLVETGLFNLSELLRAVRKEKRTTFLGQVF